MRPSMNSPLSPPNWVAFSRAVDRTLIVFHPGVALGQAGQFDGKKAHAAVVSISSQAMDWNTFAASTMRGSMK